MTILLLPALLCSFTGKKDKKEKKDQSPSEYSNVVLNLIGFVENSGLDFKNANFRVYRDNRFVGSGKTDRFGYMSFSLMKNSNYLLEFSAPGFVKKSVYISTFVPENYKGVVDFDFGVSLIPEEMVSETEICSLDAPYAVVYFNTREKTFEHNIKYTEERVKIEEFIVGGRMPL